MELNPDIAWTRALDTAQRFLGRWRDRATRSCGEDVAQEAAIEAWRGRRALRLPQRWDAFVRTIARRLRWHRLHAGFRTRTESLDADPGLGSALCVRSRTRTVPINGEAVPLIWCLVELEAALRDLGCLNERIVRSYYEGCSCRELAERFGLTESCVKVRLYRSRFRVRRYLEGRVRDSHAELDGWSL